MFTPILNTLYPLGYLLTLVFKDPLDVEIFQKINKEYTDFLTDRFEFYFYNTLTRIENVSKLEDDIEKLRYKAITEYQTTKQKNVIIVTEHTFNSFRVFNDKVDNVFSVTIKRIDSDSFQDILNIEFEVIKFRGTQRNISGTKFSVNIPSIL